MEKHIESNLETLQDLNNKASLLMIDFLKHIVMVSSTLLAVLVALIQPTADNNFLFQALVLLLLSTILSGSLAFYISLIQLRKQRKDYAVQLYASIQNRHSATKGIPAKYGSIVLFFEVLSFLSFLASLVALVCFAIPHLSFI